MPLVITRKTGTSVLILIKGEAVRITVAETGGRKVKLRFCCDPSVRIDRVDENGEIEKRTTATGHKQGEQ